MRTRTTLVPLVLLSLALSLALVGCGGKGGEAGGGTTTSAKATTTTTTAADGEQCEEITSLNDKVLAAATTGTGMAEAAEALGQLAETAPDEMADDFLVMADVYEQGAATLERSGYDPSSGTEPTPEQMVELDPITELFNSPEVEAASDNISEYVASCG